MRARKPRTENITPTTIRVSSLRLIPFSVFVGIGELAMGLKVVGENDLTSLDPGVAVAIDVAIAEGIAI